jgi:hypothetical protein
MLEEMMQQSNHFFFTHWARHKNSKRANKNTPVIIMPEMANAVIFPDTGNFLKHQELITLLRYKIRWMRSTANESGRLAQGLKRRIKGTNTIRCVRKSDVPAGCKVAYGSFVVDMKEHKEEKEWTRITVGGDQIEYPGDR